ncbi:MAG: GntR family transcriptional regulator [Prevotella sp.]|nr:GntR family transcriptional regulator [Prevotella sp.]
MDFNNEKAIYLQMADRLCDEILSGVYKADDRIPSVREYAVMLSVNTNTAVKAYEQLAREGVIYNKRGLGYFVAEDARAHIMDVRRRDFMEKRLPEVFREMRLLGINMEDVERMWKDTPLS